LSFINISTSLIITYSYATDEQYQARRPLTLARKQDVKQYKGYYNSKTIIQHTTT